MMTNAAVSLGVVIGCIVVFVLGLAWGAPVVASVGKIPSQDELKKLLKYNHRNS